MKRRGIIKTILLFSAAIGAFAAFVSAVPRPKLLLIESRRVYTIAEKSMATGVPTFLYPDYQWVSDTALLLGKKEWIDLADRSDISCPQTVKIHNLQTGRDEELAGLERQFEETMEGATYFGPIEISPDGKRVAWQIGEGGDNYIFAATLQGKRIGKRRGDEDRAFVWADNEKVLLYNHAMWLGHGSYSDDYVGIISSQHPTGDYIPCGPEAKKNKGTFLFAQGNQYYTRMDDGRDPKLDTVTFAGWNVGATVTPAGTFTVHFPAGAWFKQAALSPQGNRAAWLVERDYVSPFQRFMAKFLHRSITPQAQEQILVSNIDGSEMREIGTFDVPPGEDIGEEDKISNLRWLPGGKQLSFEHDGGLWTVPAP